MNIRTIPIDRLLPAENAEAMQAAFEALGRWRMPESRRPTLTMPSLSEMRAAQAKSPADVIVMSRKARSRSRKRRDD